MPTPPLSESDLRAVLEAYKANGYSKKLAAEALGLKPGTYDHRYTKAILAGLDNDIVHPAPAGHQIKGVSTLYKPDGAVVAQWVKTRADGPNLDQLVETVQAAFDDLYNPAEPILPPEVTDASTVTLFPLPDMHLSLYAWAAEAGQNWDLQIATDRYRETMQRVADSSPRSDTAIILGGGDYLHANTNEFRTQSGHVLDGDGRTDKVIDAAVKLAVFQIDLALARHQSVIVRILKGNHDEYSSIAIVYALAAWYRSEPRVTIDKDPSLFWWFRFGKTLLGGTHGHTTKVKDMPLIMANRKPEDWGQTKHRYIHMFHIHHKTQYVFEGGGVVAESHQSPVAQDAYHFGRGYLSARSMQSITYHAERGEIARTRVSLD